MFSISKSKIFKGNHSLRHPSMTRLLTRVETFIRHNWPKYETLTPNVLANAGFFFSGKDDEVTCFYCGVIIKGWSNGDEATLEHALANCTCWFIKTYRWRQGLMTVESNKTYIELQV